MERAATIIVLALTALVLSATQALAQNDNGLEYSISPASGPAGTTINFSGSGCEPEGEGMFILATEPEGNFPIQETQEFTADGDGNFSGSIMVPQDADPGEYPTGVMCENDNQGWPEDFDYAPFTVTEGEGTREDTPDAREGDGDRERGDAPRGHVRTGSGPVSDGGLLIGAGVLALLAAGSHAARRSTM